MQKSLEELRKRKYPRAEVNAAITWLDTGKLPPDLTADQARRFKSKYRSFTTTDEGVVVPGATTQLVYSAEEDDKVRALVATEDIDAVLKQLMLNIATAYHSRDSLYYYCQDHFIGISQADCMRWLKDREWYQLQQTQASSRVKAPVVSTHRNHIWQIDHAEPIINDASEDKKAVLAAGNGGYRYLFNVVDHFTRYLWCIPTKTRGESEYLPALKQIIKAHGAPEILQADNSFRDTGKLGALAKKHGFEIRNSEAYRPNQNGLVERVNGIIKRRIAQFMVSYETEGWHSHIQDIVANYNNTRHSVTKVTPAEAYMGAAASANPAASAKAIAQRNQASRRKMIAAVPKLPTLRKGDIVRVHHRPEHARLKNKILRVQWTTELFTIVDRHQSNAQPFFTIADAAGKPRARRYARDELLKVDPATLDRTNYSAD